MFTNESQLPTLNLDQQSQPSSQLESRATNESRVRVDSQHLLKGGRELFIAHGGEEYRLRLTRNDKLILTK